MPRHVATVAVGSTAQACCGTPTQEHAPGATSTDRPMTHGVRLEGFHAVKHAVRFGAVLTGLVTPDPDAVDELRRALAPDLDLAGAGLTVVDRARWDELAPHGLPSPLLGWARRPSWSLDDAAAGVGPVVVLERPRHLGNLGAVVRVAAAADAAGVVVVGGGDPFHPRAVRGAAGLQWALPVVTAGLDGVRRVAADRSREVVALDGAGEPLGRVGVGDAVVLLGTERHGLTADARALADRVVRVPMREGVASLTLATAAAVALYAGR